MAYTRIKICGITRPEDARVAVDAGADAIGMVFYDKSPRLVSREQAAEVASVVAPFTAVVGLFVNASADEVRAVLDATGIDTLQFQGDESPAFCAQFGRPWIKALRVKPGLDLQAVAHSYSGARALLLDSWRDGIPGGTGETFDWRLARTDLARPVVLAGGLHPANIASALATVGPAGVDVSSGVEQHPGIKDPEKIRRFIRAVRDWDRQSNGIDHDQ